MRSLVAASIAAVLAMSAAHAADKVRLIISTTQAFEMWAPEEALSQGYFKDEGLDVSIIYGDGGTSSLQAVATGGADIIIGNGSQSVMSAFSKGAPVKIISNSRRGVGELIYYVRPDSPIKTIQDLNGKQLAFSRPGSTTFLVGNFIIKERKLDTKLVSVGGMPASRTQVMSGQIDTGWAAAPSMLDEARKGNIRIFITGNDVPGLADYSIRVNAANADWLAKNRDVAVRFQRAHWKGMLNLFNSEAAVKRYADRWGIDFADAKQMAGKYTLLKDVTFAPIGRVDDLIKLSIEYDMMKETLTDQQKKDLIDIVYDPGPVK